MNRSMIVALVGTFTMMGACKPDSAHKADRAAHTLVQYDNDVSRAADEFAIRRKARVDVLAAQHGVIATQPMVIQTLVESLPLSDIGRSDVSEKLTVFEMRLDDAAHGIAGLANATASEFATRDDVVTKQMSRLEDARKSAWKAIGDAPRIDRAASL